MKNLRKYFGTLVLIFTLSAAFAQTPPPPNNGDTSGGGGGPVGGGAPVGSGIVLLSVMAGAYGGQKFWKNLKL